MIKLAKLIGPSGGLFYHCSAYKNLSLWQSYIIHLQKWLLTWPLSSKKLCIIGPSGGYSLTTKFLAQFEQIACVDPDPLAKHIFKARFPKVKVQWDNRDYFKFEWSKGLSTKNLVQLKNEYPNHALLFSNILGQISQISGCPSHHSSPSQILKTLNNNSWASYHDLFSFGYPHKLISPANIGHFVFTLSVSDSIKIYHDNSKDYLHTPQIQKILAKFIIQGRRRDLLIKDHETESLFGIPHSCQIIPWIIKPGYIHLIEAIHQSDFIDYNNPSLLNKTIRSTASEPLPTV